MDNFNKLFPENLYHSYIVEGDPEITSRNLYKFLEGRGEISTPSLDVFMKIYDSFSVSDSHDIKEWHNKLAIGNNKKICIIGTNFINHDAERTLLKIIEEPTPNTHFFIIVPNSSILLDTLRSRVQIVNTTKKENDSIVSEASKFVLLKPKERIDFINKMIKEYKNSQSNSNLRFASIKFIDEIEKIIFEKFKADKTNKKIQFILKELQEKREYLNLPGVSIKMILEDIALVL